MSRISNVRRKESCRWSDPILRRRKATASGDSDSSATSYAGSILSPSIKNPPPPPPPSPPSSCVAQDSASLAGCWCHRQCQESNRNSLLLPRHSANRRKSSQSHIVQRVCILIILCDLCFKLSHLLKGIW